MIINVLVPVCVVLYSCGSISGQSPPENEVKRGQYPYMAFIYYPDDTIVDTIGSRFIQNAVLLKPEWLVSTAIDPMMSNDVAVGFPAKTLLARAGAITIDAKMTLNEDENEQEIEVIRIVRPANHDMYKFWLTDVTLLKTLQPFKETLAVAVASLATTSYTDKVCTILVFMKQSNNATADKVLTQLPVEMLTPSADTCGAEYAEKTMTCASDSGDTSARPADYCHGNEGGPVICENFVVGLQTYLNNQCKPPHLFQLLSGWDSLISCATEEKTSEELCSQTCRETNKDEPRVSGPPAGHTGGSEGTTIAAGHPDDNSTAAADNTTDAHASSQDHTDAEASTDSSPSNDTSSDGDATTEEGHTAHDHSENCDHAEHSLQPGEDTSDIEVANSTTPSVAGAERRMIMMNKTGIDVRVGPKAPRSQMQRRPSSSSTPKRDPVTLSAELIIVIANLLLVV